LAAVSVAYEAAGLATPSPDELAATMNIAPPEMRRLITSLLREKVLVRLGSDSLFVHQRALSELIQEIQALRGQMIDIAGFKNMAGVSRKYAIPLLEYLDRERVTRKQGDLRIVL
jgi:selenocysteine-specific elongation factor